MKKADVAILGAGLMGSLLAWRLAKAGLRVELYEKSHVYAQNSAAWAAAAMLAPLSESIIADDFVVSLGSASLLIWKEWLPQLSQPVFFQQKGSLVLWHKADRVESQHFERLLKSRAPAELVQSHFHKLNCATDIAQYEPALADRFEQAFLLSGEAQLDNRQLLAALSIALKELNVPIHLSHSISIQQPLEASVVLDCRGLGAKEVFKQLRGIRGEVARVYAPHLEISRPVRILHPRYPLYIVPKENHHYVIGATEIEGEDFSEVSVRSALELLSAAFAVSPQFAEARIMELNAQCRPTLPDHRPAIAWLGKHYLAINGLYRHGYMIAPALVDATLLTIDALLAGQITDINAWHRWQQQAKWPALFHHYSIF